MRLGRRGIDGVKVLIRRNRAQRLEQPLPDLAPRPAVPAIVDRRVGTIDMRAVAPAATAGENMNDTAQNAAIVDPARARLIARKTGRDRSPLPVTQPEFIGHVILHP